jgi:hypothetical protein
MAHPAKHARESADKYVARRANLVFSIFTELMEG